MFGRPRCREWTPLATQQLRLRSLIQIVGYNIRPPEFCSSQCSFYLTLHHTTMSAPYYTSERISSPHPKWKEIDSEITQYMSSTNLVIRIWCHILHPGEGIHTHDTVIQTWGIYLSGLRYIGANLASNFTSDCFKSNTLVFQMHGGYFCSYKSLKLDVIPAENEVEQESLSSGSSGRTCLSKITLEGRFLLNNKLKESRSISPSKFTKKLEKEYSKSHSPIERGFQQNFPMIRTSASLNIGQSQRDSKRRDDSNERKPDPNHIYEHSPEQLDVKEFTTNELNCDSLSKNASQEDLSASKIDLSETAESYDLRNETDGVPKYRYLAMSFLKSEIRHSYNATKLQKLHLLQYSIKKRQEAVQDIKERIYKKSALTDTWPHLDDPFEDRVKFRSRSQRNLFLPDDSDSLKDKSPSQSDLSAKNGRVKDDRPIISNGPRLTLKLNDLLSFKSKPSPFQRAEHIRLTKQIEILRFKKLILSDERDSKLVNIRKLKERHAKLSEENQDIGSELMQNYHTLSRRNESIREARQSCTAMRELAARSHVALTNQRCELLNQLHQIFYIEQLDATTYTIVGVPLPVSGDACARGGQAARDATAAAYAARALCVAAALLHQPTRYALAWRPDAPRLCDVAADLPDPNIPLSPRGGDVTLFRYAMFLLNKCVAQLCAGRGLHVADIRPTLANLKRLLTAPSHVSDTAKLYGSQHCFSDSQCPRTQSLRSLVASERKYRQFNRFKDAVDGHSPQSAMNLRRHRHSRSVGSYHDDQELPTLDASTTSIMGSESNIYNMKLSQHDSSEMDNQTPLKTHNSDSEISRLSVNTDRVLFTLGDDEPLSIESKLVRISSNNRDELACTTCSTCTTCLDDNVKRICTEITDYCTTNTDSYEIHEGFDVARHLSENPDSNYAGRRLSSCASETEDMDLYESNRDGVCQLTRSNVTDVIVIPSAEGILDTGQYTENDSNDIVC